MSDIFRVLCQDVADKKIFGICDDKPNERAYLDTNRGAKWLATIQNNSKKEIAFTALDNCIEIRKSDGKMSSRCEGILTYDNTIIFVEAKERAGKASTWAKDADDQIRATIENIERRIDLSGFQSKRAAITNNLQKGSKEKHSARIKKFFDDTGYVLRVDNRIVIE